MFCERLQIVVVAFVGPTHDMFRDANIPRNCGNPHFFTEILISEDNF